MNVRFVTTSLLIASAFAFSCSSDPEASSLIGPNDELLTGGETMTSTGGAHPGSGGATGGSQTSGGGGSEPLGGVKTGGASSGGANPSGGVLVSSGGTSGGTTPSGGFSSGGISPSGGNSSGGASPSGGTYPSGGAPSGGTSPSGGVSTGGAEPCPPCTDVQTSDHQGEPCSIWVEWGHCGEDWLQGFCDRTCGRCNGECGPPGSGTGGEGSGGSGGSGGGDNSGGSTGGGNTVHVDPLPGNAQDGWASRYWDCCKPHCAWYTSLKMCTRENQPLYDGNATSSCEGGSAYTCWDMAPWAVADNLAYGYAATPAGGNDCGRCYQLEFKGTGEHDPADPGSVSLAGKTMIVQATNIGGDVGSGQFDLLIPGGGVGQYNGCAQQWGRNDLGETYGGFLRSCQNDVSCLKAKCQDVFANMPQLLAGCMFHVEWMKGADNPQLRWAEVSCPQELRNRSGM